MGHLCTPHCFNSTLVQLKVCYGIVLNVIGSCFNSTLVQLKADGNSLRVGRQRVSILP